MEFIFSFLSVILGSLIVYTQISEKTVQILKTQLQDFLRFRIIFFFLVFLHYKIIFNGFPFQITGICRKTHRIYSVYSITISHRPNTKEKPVEIVELRLLALIFLNINVSFYKKLNFLTVCVKKSRTSDGQNYNQV